MKHLPASSLRPFRVLTRAACVAALCLAGALPRLTAAASPAAAPAGETKASASPAIRPHVLAATELINVSVEGEADLLRTVTIDDRGAVNLGLIGPVTVAGLTVEQAARAIEKAYVDGEYLRRPKVAITVERQVTRTVTVLGQVKKTGNIVIPTDRDVDIVDVIIAADGFNDLAKESAVKVTRILPDGTQKSWDDIDVGAMLKGRKDRKDALVIQPDDIINVPMRMF